MSDEQPSPFSFQESDVWQKAMTLAEHVYAKTERFPLREQPGLAASLRDSAQKIASTIAAKHFGDTQSYCKTLFTQATLAARLGHLNTEDALSILEDVEALSVTIAETKPAAPARPERSGARGGGYGKRPERRDDERKERSNYSDRKPRTYMRVDPKADERKERKSEARPDKRSRDANRAGDKRVKRNAS